MNALVWLAPRKMEVRHVAEPQLLDDEVLVKVAYAGICGSELGGYLGHSALRVPPLIMGHEFSGTISALGDQAQVINPSLADGQNVTVNPLSCTGESELQQRGLDQLCPTRQLIGAHRPGAYAEYVAVPARSVMPLPEGMSLRLAALTEPVGCAVRVGEVAGSVSGKTCLVVGAGPIGLLILQVLIGQGANRVYVADLNPERLALAEALGGQLIDPRQAGVVQTIKEATDGRGADLSVDAVGVAATYEQCISAAKTTGTVILFGLHKDSSTMPVADIIRREIVLRGSYAYTPTNFATAVDLLNRGLVRLPHGIVEAPLIDGNAWFEQLIEAPGSVAKVLLVP